MNYDKIGNFIYQLRKEKGLTQKALAQKLNISDNSVSKWERGINMPDISSLNILADIFNVSVSELLNGEYNYHEKNKDYTQLSKVIEIKNLTKSYGKKMVLNNLNLDIYEGELVGLIGPNGVGKTTLLKCILNFCKKNSGDIKIFGLEIQNNYEQIMSQIAAIIENPNFYLHLTGLNNLKIVTLLNNIQDKEYLSEVLDALNLNSMLSKKVGKYSLGMKQKLGIACALIKNPKILLLDEPTNGLDPVAVSELRHILQKINQEFKTTILISSHNLAEIENICDRVMIMDKGIVEDINVALLKHHHQSLEQVFLEKIGVNHANN